MGRVPAGSIPVSRTGYKEAGAKCRREMGLSLLNPHSVGSGPHYCRSLAMLLNDCGPGDRICELRGGGPRDRWPRRSPLDKGLPGSSCSEG